MVSDKNFIGLCFELLSSILPKPIEQPVSQSADFEQDIEKLIVLLENI